MPGIGFDATYTLYAHAYASATVTGSAQTLAQLGVTIPAWATMAFVTPETGAIRYRCDGTAPTSAVGQPIAQGQNWPIAGLTSLNSAQLIAQSGSATVSIEFRG